MTNEEIRESRHYIPIARPRPRQLNALAIWSPGACNPSGVAHSIVEACAEAMEEPGHTGTAALCTDPAIRLMVYQLAALMGMEPMAFNVGEAVADCHHALEMAALEAVRDKEVGA
jgi:hypothetical protein